jgi:VanZ family protein
VWPPLFNIYHLRDAAINIAIYIPLGMTAYLALGRRWGLPLLSGLGLSASMETIQIWTPDRDPSVLDLATNVLGTFIGVVAGWRFQRLIAPLEKSLEQTRAVDRSALSLVFTGLAWLLFPFFPLTGMYRPHQKLTIFLASPPFAPVPLISTSILWFCGGYLLREAGIRRTRMWLALSLLFLPAQFFIVDRQPLPAEMLGAVLGCIAFAFAPKDKRPAAALFMGMLVVTGLVPFLFGFFSNPFSWVPFGGLLADAWQHGVLILLTKCLNYGIAVWLLWRCGMRLIVSTGVVAALLLAVEIAQIHLSGRTAEITDPLLALLIGFGFASLER